MKVLALVEHVDRELDLICLLKHLLKAQHGITLDVASFYADAPHVLAGPAPHVVLVPFCYAAEDMVMRDYARAWPETRFLNLAWEQIFYPTHAAIKAPRDAFTREEVTHFAWSRTFADLLAQSGVKAEGIEVTGHGMYRLYRAPYRAYFPTRADLAAAFDFDPAKRWVFVPENYRWAFFDDGKLQRLSQHGLGHAELRTFRAYCRDSLAALIIWCHALGQRDDVEVIFRPRPATSRARMARFVRSVLGRTAPAFRLIKDGSAREWVLASEVVASSYSTVLIEAALAGRTVVRVEPESTPEGLRYAWCDLVAPVTSESAFVSACAETVQAQGAHALAAWAEQTFFAAPDPVSVLTGLIADKARAAAAAHPSPVSRASSISLPTWLRQLSPSLTPVARDLLFRVFVRGYFFNRETHEKDLFSAQDVADRERRWAQTLGSQASVSAPAVTLS